LFIVALILIVNSWALRFIAQVIGSKCNNKRISNLIESVGITFLVFAAEIVILGRVLNGSCNTYENNYEWKCNSQHELKQIPTDNLFILMFAPIAFSVMFHSRLTVMLIIWISVIITIIICLTYFSLITSLEICILYIFLTVLMLIEIRRQNLTYFFILQQLKMLFVENERLADESFANELRHMIGNVAHDLKTVF
jgi:hypothetical protein